MNLRSKHNDNYCVCEKVYCKHVYNYMANKVGSSDIHTINRCHANGVYVSSDWERCPWPSKMVKYELKTRSK